MLVYLHTRIEPLRLSLFLAMGLLGACGDDGATSAGTDTQTSTGTTQSTTDGTGTPTGTTDTTGAPTTGMTGTSDTGTDTTSPTTSTTTTTDGETTAVSATTLDTTTLGTTTVDTTTTTSTTGDTDTDTDTGPDPECTILMQGMTDPPVPSGWVKCGDKLPHRVAEEVCLVPAPPTNCPLNGQPCQTNDDCTDQPFGSCQYFNVGFEGCGCTYGCETDADCDAGFVCRCGGDILGAVSQCVPSECTSDADCGDQLCQFSQSMGYDCAAEVVNGACTTPNDLCDTDPPCGDSPCAFNTDNDVWECSLVACGRPFMVDEQAVTAPAAARDDWRAVASVPMAPSQLRAALAAHWTQIALAEHASVASFARHVLQLLAVGAPPEFVLDTQRALADEIEHARLCFALASSYGGAGVGPGPLAQAHEPGAADLESVVAAVIREACVGETLSALEAREAAERAEDPGLRRILGRIADDEQRHAELGWRFVRWAREQLGDDARARTDAVFADAVAEAAAAAGNMAREAGTPELRAHGVVDAPLRASVWLRGLEGLVQPAAAALRAAA
ncbi:ferritin-like domain-containing protein [Nannocystis sp. ILAH1]|uniref:ferritin-like domain-containing protein n=1 Tax=unclassified Nannocystis TaxID=2627009 RepID=UPI00226F94BF|nr:MULTISPECIES: ferritin-like domain-containing protein [unclassified Nannocystis]MCY0993879.1 ferritin-like domain-containing protein [Nannocystis sp. ILAH1]MCY1065757.1 ferritin-like domain-containing protein [Nannocystis sp. RBIL2]